MRRLVAAIACRNQGSRLYGKPLQNLDVERGVRVLDQVLACVSSIASVDEVVLGIAEGVENRIYVEIADALGIRHIIGDGHDVLGRLIQCGNLGNATDIFRVTSESPYMYFEEVEALWKLHQVENADATFMDEIVDGCGFQLLSLAALKASHEKGTAKHRSEFCSLYIREHPNDFKILKKLPPDSLIRKDLRLTVDYPEDLVVCRAIYTAFKDVAPRIPVSDIVEFLDRNPDLIALTAPFTESGYATMYR